MTFTKVRQVAQPKFARGAPVRSSNSLPPRKEACQKICQSKNKACLTPTDTVANLFGGNCAAKGATSQKPTRACPKPVHRCPQPSFSFKVLKKNANESVQLSAPLRSTPSCGIMPRRQTLQACQSDPMFGNLQIPDMSRHHFEII